MTAEPSPAPRPEPQPIARIPVAELIAMPLTKAIAISGLSRATIYRLAGNGALRLLKSGRTTLVCAESLRAYMASLPAAEIRAPKRKAA